MQLSLLADNRDALSLSFEEGESAFLCSSRSLSLPVHPQQQRQQQQERRTPAPDMSAVWNVRGGKRQALVNCVSHFCRTRCPARRGPRHRGYAGRRDGWTCALFHCSTHACRSTSRALTPAGELRDFILRFLLVFPYKALQDGRAVIFLNAWGFSNGADCHPVSTVTLLFSVI